MLAFIVNRLSGNGKGLAAWLKIEPLLEQKGIPYVMKWTEDAQDAAVWIGELPEHVRIVVAVGGDGTIQSLVPSAAARGLPIGLIPAGSGNDYARGLGIPLEAVAALEYLLTAEPCYIDLLNSHGKASVTVVGMGLDGLVAQMVNRSWYKGLFNKLRMGPLSYVFGLFEALFHYRPASVQIKVDGVKYDFTKVWLIAAANMSYYGGGMRIAPDAKYDDGQFSLCIVSGIHWLHLLLVFPRVFSGSHRDHPAVTWLSGQELEVWSEPNLVVHGDGEVLGHTPWKLKLKHKSLKVMAHPIY